MAIDFWKFKKVIVTGGSGFLGRYVVERLRENGCRGLFIPRSKDYNLATEEAVQRLYRDFPCDMVIHLAGTVGGIGASVLDPGKFYYDNLVMGTTLMEYARRNRIEKFVAIGTTCSYPKGISVPFKEKDVWNGYPEGPTAPYGLAKRMLQVQSQVYRQQHGFNAIVLLPVNLYGPRDNFDLETSHVVAALIRKCWEAKLAGRKEVAVWGTGKATREFLFAEDASEGILLAAEKYNQSDPVNLGSGYEIQIRDLAELICELMDYEADLVWDTSKPNGHLRRCVDISKAQEAFGFRAKTGLKEGLKKTIQWYTQSHSAAEIYPASPAGIAVRK